MLLRSGAAQARRNTPSKEWWTSVQSVAVILPDVLQPGLDVVFCGTAAGSASARVGAYYAGPGNAFWETLHSVGLTPFKLDPTEFQRLPDFGIGLTDVCKVTSGPDSDVGKTNFDVPRLAASIAEASPDRLAFNGKNSARAVLDRQVDYGLQPERIGGAEVWVLPSTSGMARRFWNIGPWRDLAQAAGIRQSRV